MESKKTLSKLGKKVLESGLVQTSKKHLINYDKPTPKKWRRIGDGLLLVSGVITLFVPTLKWAIALGMIGKYMSNLASE